MGKALPTASLKVCCTRSTDRVWWRRRYGMYVRYGRYELPARLAANQIRCSAAEAQRGPPVGAQLRKQ